MEHSLWYDDLSVGDTYESTLGWAVTEAAIIEFARLYDPQPGHLDPQQAREGAFQGLAASGWQTAAITMRLLTEVGFPLDQAIGAGMELSWPTPTRPGDVLSLRLTVQSKRISRTKPDRGVVQLHYDTYNQLGEPRQTTTATLIIRRAPDRV